MRVLQGLHESKVVDGLLTHGEQSNANGPAVFRSLCRLHFKEADSDGKWWGTRPDVTGPYFKPVPWAETPRIAAYLKKALAKARPEEQVVMASDLARHRIDFPEATATLLKLVLTPCTVSQLWKSWRHASKSPPKRSLC